MINYTQGQPHLAMKLSSVKMAACGGGAVNVAGLNSEYP